MDVYLPDEPDLALLRELDIDAFVLSAASDPATVRAAVRAGALNYLVKPFSRSQLTERLMGYARFRGGFETAQNLHQQDSTRPCARCATRADSGTVEMRLRYGSPDAPSTSTSGRAEAVRSHQ